MSIQLTPLPLSPKADPVKMAEFGREIKGVDLNNVTPTQFAQIREALYKHEVILFRDVKISPADQAAFTKAFDPTSNGYGHAFDPSVSEISTRLLQMHGIPGVPEVQLIGHGTIFNHEGVARADLNHPTHKEFHKTVVSPEDEAKGYTRYYRWHIDAAFYDLSPPRVTSLYGAVVPKGIPQIVRYDDGSGDELPVTLGATAFASGNNTFELLPAEYKSLAVRMKIKYAPHLYAWVNNTHAVSSGIAIENEGLEVPLGDLPPWTEEKRKVLSALWKNEVTGKLHFQVHPSIAHELLIDPLPAGANRTNALYPDGAHITDLRTVRDILFKIQRPGIASNLVYAHDWQKNDLVLFHNRGLMHSVTGALKDDDIRVFHQCNLHGSDDPAPPSAEDVKKYA
ncbi:taurine catabolism dioxygenase [Collybia nuda]|uniref:Taurine catabolism dioxygenase n=1 Tax=Collybia nuda TaxID=64659 RepID=A0A9P6CGD5_9AGAR|nr:taurine catabolism dioxygenase [Collybia nuda]